MTETWALVLGSLILSAITGLGTIRVVKAQLEVHIQWIREQLTTQDKRLTYLEHQGGRKK
jgi:hypothetical protein